MGAGQGVGVNLEACRGQPPLAAPLTKACHCWVQEGWRSWPRAVTHPWIPPALGEMVSLSQDPRRLGARLLASGISYAALCTRFVTGGRERSFGLGSERKPPQIVHGRTEIPSLFNEEGLATS